DTLTLVNNKNFTTTNHKVNVYLPPGYENSNEHFPVAFFNDGSFYINGGSAINILDNLIYEKRIKPIIGVFVDYSPGNRSKEYATEPDRYIDFFNTILVPYIDANYRTIPDGYNRALIGLSFGGNVSALIANSVKDMYKNCGLHSGAIWPRNFEAQTKIIQNDWGIKYYLVWGTYEPALMELGITVRDSLTAKGYQNFKWGQYYQGHTMGFWRGVTDNFLEYFFPGENLTSINTQNEIILDESFQLNQNYPNPFNPETTISYSLKESGFVQIKIYDVLGREIQTLINSYKSPGNHNEVFNASKLPSGNYFYSMQFGGKFVTKKMSLIK
ncbi:MAG: T9SS type A sorting domain-containing protein, partial [Melioribacteraceae bacterium]